MSPLKFDKCFNSNPGLDSIHKIKREVELASYMAKICSVGTEKARKTGNPFLIPTQVGGADSMVLPSI